MANTITRASLNIATPIGGYALPLQPPFVQDGINIGEIPAVKNGLIDERQVAYCLANRRFANPKGEPLIGIYGASGPDMITVLLSTDAHQIFCIEQLPIDIRNLKKQRARMGRQFKDIQYSFTRFVHREDCLWYRKDFKKYREQLIMCELNGMGIRRSSIDIRFDVQGNPVVTFPWAFPGKRAKERQFTYITADLTKPDQYPETLSLLMSAAIVDFYYEKSSMFCHHDIGNYLTGMADSVSRFIMMGPSASNEMHVIGTGRLGSILSREFKSVTEVNNEYWKYFLDPPDPANRLLPYFWRVDLWKRK